MGSTTNNPEPSTFENDIFRRGLQDQRPRFTTDSSKWAHLAHERLSADAWAYVHGSAGQRETDDKNLAAFRKWSIVPERLVDMKGSLPDMSATVFGQRVPFPIALAPVGVQSIFHHRGEIASAKAAGLEKVPFIFSSASSTSPEAVAEANGASSLRWYQVCSLKLPTFLFSIDFKSSTGRETSTTTSRGHFSGVRRRLDTLHSS